MSKTGILVDGAGRPVRKEDAEFCPKCGSGPDKRTNANGFGEPIIICTKCGTTVSGGDE